MVGEARRMVKALIEGVFVSKRHKNELWG